MEINCEKSLVELNERGYAILENLYSKTEVDSILKCIENSGNIEGSFTKTKDLFAIRKLLDTIPDLKEFIFNEKLKSIISSFGENYFLTKAIYFDKPSESNWFVAYHQDLSISVSEKYEIEGYKNWTFKKGQYGVQPPLQILQNICTVRIHLDDTNKENGALKVISKSHSKGIYRPESIDWTKETEHICEVQKGGAMLMKPLLLHASNRTTNKKQRRIVHLEFSNQNLSKPLNWLEALK